MTAASPLYHSVWAVHTFWSKNILFFVPEFSTNIFSVSCFRFFFKTSGMLDFLFSPASVASLFSLRRWLPPNDSLAPWSPAPHHGCPPNSRLRAPEWRRTHSRKNFFYAHCSFRFNFLNMNKELRMGSVFKRPRNQGSVTIAGLMAARLVCRAANELFNRLRNQLGDRACLGWPVSSVSRFFLGRKSRWN